MVVVAARPLRHVQRKTRVRGEAAEELLEQLGVDLADLVAREAHVPGQERPAGDVDRRFHKRLVHRHQRLPVAPDAALVADGACERLPQRDAGILRGVVEIDMQVALRLDLEVEQGVPSECGQHVVEEADAGGNPGAPGAIETQRQGDRRLAGDPVHLRAPARGKCCGP